MPKVIVLMPWGRTGSNLLMSYLRKAQTRKFAESPAFANESLNGNKDADKQMAWLEEFYDAEEPFVCSKQSTLAIQDNPRVSAFLAARGIRVIRMFRRNLFKATLSQIRAEQYAEVTRERTGKAAWAVRKDEAPLGATKIDPEIFLHRYKVFEEQSRVLERDYNDNDRHDVYYEDLHAEMDATLRGVSVFLELPTFKFDPPFRKATPDGARSVIENMDELDAFLNEHGLDTAEMMKVG